MSIQSTYIENYKINNIFLNIYLKVLNKREIKIFK